MVSSETTKISYSCNGSLVAFTFPFKIFAAGDLEVTITDASGVETVLTLTTDYTVAGDEDGDFENGGTVTTVATYAAGNTITIARDLDYTQESDYIENDPLPAETLEDDLDRIVILTQQLNEKINRQLTAPITDAAGISLQIPNSTNRANKVLAFDASGEPIASEGTAVAVSAWAATFVDDTTAAAARTTLDVYSKAEVDNLVDLSEEAVFIDGQTVDAGVSVGDPVFKNVTKEVVDLCDVADWTDDAEITTSVETSETILSNALRLTKDAGAATTAATSKTTLTQIDFTSKDLNLFLYIDDAATLAKLAATDGLIIRYGSDASNYYQWSKDRADLAVGWNTIKNLDTDNEDSTTGAPTIAAMDYIYVALVTNAASDTWAAGKVILDHIYVSSDEEWQKAISSTITPQGIFVGSGKIVLKGYTDQLSNLIEGQVYWMDSSGNKVITAGESYNNAKLGYALSDTEFIVDIAVEGYNNTVTTGIGRGGTVKGFWMGRFNGANLAVIDDMVFSDESSSQIAATLDVARAQATAISASTKGYAMGGEAGGNHASIDDMIFVDETSQAIAATLDTAKYGGGGVFSDTKGYVQGGYVAARIDVIEDIIFADETSQAIAETLDTALDEQAAVCAAAKGYTLGGYGGAASAVIQDFIYATELSAQLAATLNTAKYGAAGVFSALKGYSIGGGDGAATYYDLIDDFVFATEVDSRLAATLDDSRWCDGVSAMAKGFAGAGNDAAYKDIIDDMVFSNDTSQQIAATLDDTGRMPAGVQY